MRFPALSSCPTPISGNHQVNDLVNELHNMENPRKPQENPSFCGDFQVDLEIVDILVGHFPQPNAMGCPTYLQRRAEDYTEFLAATLDKRVAWLVGSYGWSLEILCAYIVYN